MKMKLTFYFTLNTLIKKKCSIHVTLNDYELIVCFILFLHLKELQLLWKC